ncbi:MAG: penicillin-binding transpeptidase domain-containing protein [Peptococcaceae bacterium]|nr:penicillin-binding transpeptidase domain-containing protein [Peptococcaceae bacterium]
MRKKILLGLGITLGLAALITAGIFAYSAFSSSDSNSRMTETVTHYFAQIGDGQYEDLYELLSERSQTQITKEDFVTRNKNIYEGIEAKNISVTVTETYPYHKKPDSLEYIDHYIDQMGSSDPGSETADMQKTWRVVDYEMRMDTLAGEIFYTNFAVLSLDTEKKYRIEWAPQWIFPKLAGDDKVRVNRFPAKRGNLFDRNGVLLAGEGSGTQEAFDAQDGSDAQMAALEGRFYPLGEKASHLIGYIQSITAEELEDLGGQGYHGNSLIGKVGLEKLYEERLRAQDGCEIIITDHEGTVKEILVSKEKVDGKNLTLTLDAQVQTKLYNQFFQDKSCAVAMNPKTGEILGLVSTPTYNANDFIQGMPQAQWTALNEDRNKPLYNRFKAAYCPGSTFKALTAAIGLDTGAFAANDDFGHSGLVWKKDAGWGGYSIVTTKEYVGPANTENALKFSDNIYFGKAALKIGPDNFAQQLKKVGFEESLPFDFGLAPSTFSTTKAFESEIQLADSGYGQGQILINPLHLASIYSAFVNEGSMIRPYVLQEDSPQSKSSLSETSLSETSQNDSSQSDTLQNEPSVQKFWKENVFKPETADSIKKFLVQVVESGTATDAQIPGLTLGGKTGTAEIKQSVDDVHGTQLGWFVLLTADASPEDSLLVIAMVEDVQNRGGSHYVVPKVKRVFET